MLNNRKDFSPVFFCSIVEINASFFVSCLLVCFSFILSDIFDELKGPGHTNLYKLVDDEFFPLKILDLDYIYLGNQVQNKNRKSKKRFPPLSFNIS